MKATILRLEDENKALREVNASLLESLLESLTKRVKTYISSRLANWVHLSKYY